ncbi:transposase [Nostoc sp. CHAB 5834]|nr:transposase [Nostoc sp. CHAB 5834]
MTDKPSYAVRSRIDWKYGLSLKLTDPGFDFSVLCEFRIRLISGSAEQKLLDILLKQLKEKGKQRTDSTHVLAAIRFLVSPGNCSRNFACSIKRSGNGCPRMVALMGNP